MPSLPTPAAGRAAPLSPGAQPPTPTKPVDDIAFAPNPSPDTAAAVDAATAKEFEGATGHVVAPGRTVDGKGPGETVNLDEKDAKRFLDLGFILDKDGAKHVSEAGPAVNVEDGVQVKPV